jgi:hypothetical protein
MGWLEHDLATLRHETSADAKNLFQKALAAARQVHDLYCAVEAEISLCWQELSVKEAAQAGVYLESLRRALSSQLHPQLRAGIEVASAAEAQQHGNLAEAGRLYREAVSFCSAYHCNAWKRRALIGLGATHWHLRDTGRAKQVWDEALQLARLSSEAKRVLAEAIIEFCQHDPQAIPR